MTDMSTDTKVRVRIRGYVSETRAHRDKLSLSRVESRVSKPHNYSVRGTQIDRTRTRSHPPGAATCLMETTLETQLINLLIE